MEQGGRAWCHGSAWGNTGRLPGGRGLRAEPQPVVLGSRALGQRPKTAHHRPPKARPPATGWQPPEWRARAQSLWHVQGGPAYARRQLPFLSSPNKWWHPPPTGPRHPRVSITTPAQGLTRPAQILGRTSCGLWSRAALGTPAVGPRACLLPSEGLGFAQAHPSPPSSRARGRARLPLCPSILTPASTRGAQRRGPWAPGPGSRRQTMAGPSVITRSEGKMAPGAQVT